MIYIYRAEPSEGARALAAAVGGYKVTTFSPRKKRKDNDIVICWGEEDPQIPGIGKVLNGGPLTTKFTDAKRLALAGVPTIEVRRAGEVRERDNDTYWIPRKNNHVGGNDIIKPPSAPDYWSKYVKLEKEFRIHCFKGKSLRAGQKIPREGVKQHEWCRSFDGGWRISYDEFKSSKELREVAAKAIEALGLDFGAVDIGKIGKGSNIVLEVNRAPGLEGNTITTYAEAIKKWASGEWA